MLSLYDMLKCRLYCELLLMLNMSPTFCFLYRGFRPTCTCFQSENFFVTCFCSFFPRNGKKREVGGEAMGKMHGL